MTNWLDALKDLFDWLKDQGPAILLALFQYEEAKIEKSETLQAKAEYDLQIEKNHEQVDAALNGKSDADIILDATKSGSDTGQP